MYFVDLASLELLLYSILLRLLVRRPWHALLVNNVINVAASSEQSHLEYYANTDKYYCVAFLGTK